MRRALTPGVSGVDLDQREQIARRRAAAGIASVLFAAVGALIGVAIATSTSQKFVPYQCTFDRSRGALMLAVDGTLSREGGYECVAVNGFTVDAPAPVVTGLAAQPSTPGRVLLGRLVASVLVISICAVGAAYVAGGAASRAERLLERARVGRLARPWRAWWLGKLWPAAGAATMAVWGIGLWPAWAGVAAAIVVPALYVWREVLLPFRRRGRLREYADVRLRAEALLVAKARMRGGARMSPFDAHRSSNEQFVELHRRLDELAASVPVSPVARVPAGAGAPRAGSWRAWWRSRPRARRVS